MKLFSHAHVFAAAFSALLALCSCGSLVRDVQPSGLNADDMAYIDAIPPGKGDCKITTVGAKILGAKSSTCVWPAFPIFSVESFFKDSASERYGLLHIYTFMPVLPVYVGADAQVFNSKGLPESDLHFSGVPIIYSFISSERGMDSEGKAEKIWRFGLVDFPYINSLLSFGSDNFQFLWIPVISPSDKNDVVEIVDLDYTPGDEFK